MAQKKLKALEKLKIDFCPSPKQYELWKLLQPECPLCVGEVEQMLIGYDAAHNPRYKPYCKQCGNQNIPQMVLGGGAAGGGKSFVSSVWLVSSCIRFPDIRAVVVRNEILKNRFLMQTQSYHNYKKISPKSHTLKNFFILCSLSSSIVPTSITPPLSINIT